MDKGKLTQLMESQEASSWRDREGNSLLHLAVMGGYVDLVGKLLDRGADPYRGNTLGFTSVQLALYLKKDKLRGILPLPPLPNLMVQEKGVSAAQVLKVDAFAKRMGIRYCQQIHFHSYALLQSVAILVKKELANGGIGRGAKQIGIHYHEALNRLVVPPVSIRWVNDRIGYGLFAENILAKDQFVGNYTGHVRWRGPLQGLIWGTLNDYTYRYPIGTRYPKKLVVDAQREGNHTRYLNHSDKPNLDSRVVYCDGLMHIVFMARRPIEEGEQLCFDYGDYFWKKGDTYVPMP